MLQSKRTIGIRHRTKATAQNEARPTQVAIQVSSGQLSKVTKMNLVDEDAELDFLLGRLEDDSAQLEPGDTVCMVLGGSGDNFAFAIANRLTEIGGKIIRIPASKLKDNRDEAADKDDDAALLTRLALTKPELFYEFRSRDAELINVRELYRQMMETMKARIATGQRLRQQMIGKIFRNTEGRYPEGKIEQMYDELVATNTIYVTVKNEEKACRKDLAKALERLDVFQIFEKVEGCGPSISARIIAGVVDIRRFPTKAKFRTFCGVGVTADKKFPRKRRNEICNWNPGVRQGLYLLGDQFVKRADSVWGKKYRQKKIDLRAKHPVGEIGEGGKKRYTDGHGREMDYWWTIGKFAEYLFNEWWKLENGNAEAGETDSSAAA